MRKFKNTITLLVFALLSLSYVSAKQPGAPGVMAGILKDSLSNEPLYYGTVTLVNSGDSSIVDGATANEKGIFVLREIPYGTYDLKCSFMGFRTTNINGIKIAPENPVIRLGEIKLFPFATETEGVTVTGERDLITYQIDKKVVNVEQHVNAKGGSASDVLENIPSVRVDVEGNVSLRGSNNFTLLVDGKPTIFEKNEFLKSTPADMIDNIEIITNPSAKYNPEGTSGIINVVMKKEDRFGTNGLISTSLGTRDKYSMSTQMNLKNSKMNFFTSLNVYDRKYHPFSNFTSETLVGDTNTTVLSVMDRMFNSNGYSANIGADYNINDDNQVSLSGSYGYYGFDRIFPTDYTEWDNYNSDREFYRASDDFLVGGNYYSANLNYFVKFKEQNHNINSSLVYSSWDGNVDQTTGKYNTDADFTTENDIINKYITGNDVNRTNLNYKLDYTLPFGKISKLETGFNSENLWKKFDYRREDYNILSQEYELNTNYTNKADYVQNVQSLYATYSDELFGLTFMAGLRGEYYYRLLDQLTLDEQYDMDQFNLFPSLHLSWQINQERSVQASFSRRVTRPDDRTLNPFPDFEDDYYISKGNPYLKPQFTNSVEMSFRQGFWGASFLSLEGYYRQTNDLISRKMELTDNNKILLTSENTNKDFLYGTEISANIVPATWFRFTAGANYFDYHLKELVGDIETERSSSIFDMNFSATFMPKWIDDVSPTVIQFTGYYTGDRIIADGEQKSNFATSLALSQSFMERTLTVTLHVNDLFKTSRYEFTNNGLNFKSYGYFDPERQTVNLSISYRINNYQRRPQNNDDININYGSGGF